MRCPLELQKGIRSVYVDFPRTNARIGGLPNANSHSIPLSRTGAGKPNAASPLVVTAAVEAVSLADSEYVIEADELLNVMEKPWIEARNSTLLYLIRSNCDFCTSNLLD